MQSLLNPWLVKSEKYAARFESKSFEAHILAYEQSCNAHPWAVIGTQLPPIWQKKRIRTPTESKISIQQAQARKTAVAIGPISLEARFGSMVVRHLRNVPPE